MDAHLRNAGLALGTLLASSTTLLCCVLPAVLVSIGAGATMVSLATALPQLVWLSERKGPVFAAAALLLLGAGVLILRARAMPCPAEPAAARACGRLRKITAALYAAALVAFATGLAFAFVLPAIGT